MATLHVLIINQHFYGIRASEISTITDINHVTTLPVPINRIRQIAVINNVTTYFYNLADYLEETPEPESNNYKGVLLNTDENNIGFLFQGQHKTIQYSDNDLLKFDNYFQSEIFSHYLLIDSEFISIVNLHILFNYLLKENYDKIKPDFIISVKSKEKPLNRIKKTIFQTNQVSFAVSEYLIKNEKFSIDRIHFFPFLPDFIDGVIEYKNEILPLLNLEQRFNDLKSDQYSEPELEYVTIIKITGFQFAVRMQSECIDLQLDVNTFLPLPLLVKSNWLESICIRDNSIILLADFFQLFREKANKELEKLQDEYTIDQSFAEKFTKQSLSIFEFSIQENTFVVPGEEVLDEFGLRPFYPIPDTPGPVLGVCQINREFVPVLDLLCCFGAESRYQKDWGMILMKHKFFKTLLVVEKAIGKKTIEPDIQRELPLVLPHPIVLGCYLENKIVKLILNIEAIAIYFEKIETRKVLESLAGNYNLKIPVRKKSKEKKIKIKKSGMKKKKKDKPVNTQVKPDQASKPEQSDIDSGKAIKQTEQKSQETEINKSKTNRKPDQVKKDRESQNSKAEPVDEKTAIPEKKALEANDYNIEVVEEIKESDSTASVRSSSFGFQNSQLTKIQADDAKGALSLPDIESSLKSMQRKKAKRKWLLLFTGIISGCMLVLCSIWLLNVFKQKTGDRKIKIIAKEKIQEYANQQEINRENENNNPDSKTVHDLSKTKNTEIITYEVRKGDTLARISNKYTGDYYNYPDIARENGIENPHLIFPRQRIVIEVDKY